MKNKWHPCSLNTGMMGVRIAHLQCVLASNGICPKPLSVYALPPTTVHLPHARKATFEPTIQSSIPARRHTGHMTLAKTILLWCQRLTTRWMTYTQCSRRGRNVTVPPPVPLSFLFHDPPKP